MGRPVSNKIPSRYVDMVPACRTNSNNAYQTKCEGCLRLISFLNAEDKETVIKVNDTLRNCVRHCLQRTPPGQTKNLRTILQIRDTVLTAEQTRNIIRSGKNCGSLKITKTGSPEDDVQKKRGNSEEFIRRLNRAKFEIKSLNQRPAAVTVVPALMMPSTSSTSTLVQGHGQRNLPGGVVLP